MTTTILFYFYAVVAIAGALGLVSAKKLLHGVMSLFATLVAMGGLYLLLGMEFLAAMQLFVYGGAITILVMFALMLSGPKVEQAENTPLRSRWFPAIISVVFFVAIALVVAQAKWDVVAPHALDTAAIATILFSRYVLPFEIAGLSLTIALIGAVVIARQDDMVGVVYETAAEPDPEEPYRHHAGEEGAAK
ncbi:MAG: NADH-quinone oxidoreductase subunit J [Coriobacteriia bacterium]|nr:NADH-quinone oxidoreductase subunit J [Coriobacteriia bacterium]